MRTTTPLVIGFVLALALVLLLAAFRSPPLAAAVIGLNLLSVGAAYGVLTAVFQHTWAEALLDFTSTGTVTDWLPLFAFVILFGLSMDYTILVLERIREARRAGRSAREAAAEGVAATAGTVTSAALVMVAIFAMFATLPLAEQKMLGIGLAAAILIDATIVRGIALPAAVTLLGERRWRVRPRGASPRSDGTSAGPRLRHTRAVAMHAEDLDTTETTPAAGTAAGEAATLEVEAPEPTEELATAPRRRLTGADALALQTAISALVGFVLTVIWLYRRRRLLAGLGLVRAVAGGSALHVGLRWALAKPTRASARSAIHAAITVVVALVVSSPGG